MSGIGSGQYALGGVLGEDGIDGIKIGGDYPGKAFLYFQEACWNWPREVSY